MTMYPVALYPKPETPIVTIWFNGGPLDGSSGGVAPVRELKGSIKHAGGAYEMWGFAKPEKHAPAAWMSNFMPDRVIYQWQQKSPFA